MLAVPPLQLPWLNSRVGAGKLSLLGIKFSKTGPLWHSKNDSLRVAALLWSRLWPEEALCTLSGLWGLEERLSLLSTSAPQRHQDPPSHHLLALSGGSDTPDSVARVWSPRFLGLLAVTPILRSPLLFTRA